MENLTRLQLKCEFWLSNSLSEKLKQLVNYLLVRELFTMINDKKNSKSSQLKVRTSYFLGLFLEKLLANLLQMNFF